MARQRAGECLLACLPRRRETFRQSGAFGGGLQVGSFSSPAPLQVTWKISQRLSHQTLGRGTL